MSLVVENDDTLVCLARQRDLLDLANRISKDSAALQTSLHHLTLKEFEETRRKYYAPSGFDLTGEYRVEPIPTAVPVQALQRLMQMLSVHATSLTHLTLDGICRAKRGSEEVDEEWGDFTKNLRPRRALLRLPIAQLPLPAPSRMAVFQRTILRALVSLNFASLKHLFICHLAVDCHIDKPAFRMERLLEKLQTLSVAYTTDRSLHGGSIKPGEELTRLPFARMASKTNLQSLTLHTTMPLGFLQNVVTFPNLEKLSLKGFLLSTGSKSAITDFIAAQSRSLKSLELINGPILVASHWDDDKPLSYPARLCQMADILDRLRKEMTRLCTFRYVQNKEALWNVYADAQEFTADEDGNVWNPRKCYVTSTTWIAEWLLEDFEEAPFYPDFERDDLAFRRLVQAVKARV